MQEGRMHGVQWLYGYSIAFYVWDDCGQSVKRSSEWIFQRHKYTRPYIHEDVATMAEKEETLQENLNAFQYLGAEILDKKRPKSEDK